MYPPPAALVTYNATTAGGVNVTVTRRQAMARANEVLDELAVLRAQVEVRRRAGPV